MAIELGNNLKKLRKERNLTQDELAEKLSISVKAISRYETGTAYPDIEMLPVLAGFFGVTVDNLLGISGEAKERRREEYAEQLRAETDRSKRLAILCKQHAEFPESWDVVNDMVYEMTFLPDCLDEMRSIVDNALENCPEGIWRENILMFYLKSEPDERIAEAYVDRYASKYDMRKPELLRLRYAARNETDKLESIRQYLGLNSIQKCLNYLCSEVKDDLNASRDNCRRVLDLLSAFSGKTDLTVPDMWFEIKIRAMLLLSNRSFMLSQDEDGFAVLSDAVRLFENFFALKDGTVLTYGSRMLDRFESHTEKMIFYNITEFSGMIAHSVLMNLRYSAPVGPISENEKYVYDMEGFSGNTVFAFHTSKIVSVNPGWAGFARVKDEPRYIKLAQRIKQVSSLESTDNFLFLMDSLRKRTDEFVQDKKWACAVLVGDAGAYILFDDAEDIEKKFVRMEREGNTSVHQVATVAFGGDFIETPPAIRERLLKMCPTGESIKTVLRDKNGRPVFTTL